MAAFSEKSDPKPFRKRKTVYLNLVEMGNAIKHHQYALSDFQKAKLLHEFRTFYDLNNDGVVTWSDFEVAKQAACKMNCWKPNSPKTVLCEKLFSEVWDSLQLYADKDCDGKISADEWITMWEALLKQVLLKIEGKIAPKTEEDLPMWLYKYLLHRFHVLDRTGDGIIDMEEYEYVMSHFNVAGADARKAWLMFSENNTKKIDFDTFCQLSTDYYFSNDPAAVGNFITGKLSFNNEDNKK